MEKESAGSSPPLNARDAVPRRRFASYLRSRAAIGVVIFLLAFGVRILTWHDTRLEVGKIQTSVVSDYQRVAHLIRDGGIRSFFSSTSALADLNNLGHPPGYSILLAGIYSIAGTSNTAAQMCQIAADAFCAVLLLLIVSELLPLSAGVVAGLLAAFSPQLAWNSVLLLPDSISVLPVLLAVFVLTRSVKNPRLLSFIVVGLLIGVSCWLRANFMLLPFFVAAAVLLLVKNTRRWQLAAAVICGSLLIVLPLTIRNAIVFHRFIPLSLGAGQTFLEGIADYDKPGRLGVPSTDVGIMKQESEIYQRPDYYGTLFNPDGVERERARLSRGFAVVRSHPVWFAGVMAKRASSMLRLERARLLSTRPAITVPIDLSQKPVSVTANTHLVNQANQLSAGTKLEVSTDSRDMMLTGDDSNYGAQAAWPIYGSSLIVSTGGGFRTQAHANVDYVVRVPIKMERGRMRVSIVNARNVVFATAVTETVEGLPPEEQPINPLTLPFVADGSEARIMISNEASARPSARIGPIEVYELGTARFLWTRYPRLVIHAIQNVFITAIVLSLAIIGLVILILRKNTRPLILLSVVPIYFFLVQSLVHTEYRYVLAVVYFLFAFAGVTLGCCSQLLMARLRTTSTRSASATEPAPSASVNG